MLGGRIFLFCHDLYQIDPATGEYTTMKLVNEINYDTLMKGDGWGYTASVCLGDTAVGAVGEIFVATSLGNLWKALRVSCCG